jgi:crotonobetainyl-CoA:carnitine CoA-transferase CaiB-like acyl-CoA transferase
MNDDTATSAAASAGPLAGVKVLDLTSIVMGPLATLTLAQLGAEVIKVEAPEGDNVRYAGSTLSEGMGHVFLHGNRGKKSLVLDLKKPAARQALIRLTTQSDVLLSNVRPAAMRRLGLGYEELAVANPRLIYVTACGFSARGPYSEKPAYDDLIQGATAIPWLMQAYGAAEPCYVPLSLADRLTGLHIVYAVTAALYARERSGSGQHVEVPMFESVAHFVLADHLGGRSFDPSRGLAGYDRLLSRNRAPYRTADGYLCVLIYNDRHWRNFLTAIGQPELFQDPRFSSQRRRSNNIDAIYAFVGSVMRTRKTAEWQALLHEIDIPNQTINSLEDLLADPHLLSTGFLGHEIHPSEGRIVSLGTPTNWSGTPTGGLSPAPRLGEHSAEVLAAAGFSAEEISQMAEDGSTMVEGPAA